MITVRVVDEDHNSVEDLDLSIDTRFLNSIAGDSESESLKCLMFIDAYGDTVFNRIRMPCVLQELDWLESRAYTENDKRLVTELRRMAEYVRDDVHLYLKFVGDLIQSNMDERIKGTL